VKQSLAAFLILSLMVSGCARSGAQISPGSAAQTGLHRAEAAIGEKIHAEILSQFYVYTEPTVVNYVTEIGEAMAAFAERKDLFYRFTLLYHEKIYATSAPGGFIYVTTGLLAFLDNEAELAAVIAHEIAQLQQKDPRLSKARKALNAITRTGAVVGPIFGQFGALAAIGLVMLNSVVESNQIDPEKKLLKSDTKAFQYMVDAGYDPQGFLDVLYKFLNADKKVIPYFYDYYQSRPISQARLDNAGQEFANLSLQGKSFSVNRDMYYETMRGIREIYSR